MSNNAQIEPQILQKTAFGELSTASNEPVIQITAHHGITDTVLSLSTGGAITTENGMFKLESGTSTGTITALLSDKQIQDRPGQGIRDIFSFIFDEGVTGNIQQVGLITSESAFCFAVKDEEFGILYSSGGALEIQELQITSGAGNETASITIDDTLFSVALTNNGINTNAYEIATYLNDNDARYRYSSNGDIVSIIAQLPSFGGGIFSFSSASAVGSFTEIEPSALPVDNFTPIQDWNVLPDFDIDHTKGNVGMVQFAYTGFDGIIFSLKNSQTAEFEVVHIIRYGNKNTVPVCSNPVFRTGWVTRNITATPSSVTMFGSSSGAFNEGKINYLGDSKGVGVIKSIPSNSADMNIFTIRNRRVFNDEPNRYNIDLLTLSLATESSKITTFSIIRNPTVASGDLLDFEYNSDQNSLLEFAQNDVEITGGEAFSYPVTSTKDIDLSVVLGLLAVGETVAITASISSGGSADMSASLSYKDDL